MALTNDDKARIRDTMAKFSVNISDNMMRYYATFLTTYPDYLPMFYSLRGVNPDPENLMKNDWLREQGPRFASAIADFVDNLDNYDAIETALKRLVNAPRHTKHDLKTEDYVNALKAFVTNMKAVLEDGMTKADVDSWNKFVQKLQILIDSEMKKIGK